MLKYWTLLFVTLVCLSVPATGLAQENSRPKATPAVQELLDAAGKGGQSWQARFTEYQSAEKESVRLNDRVGESLCLFWQAKCLFRLGQYPESMEMYKNALTLQREVHDRTGEAASLTNIGAICNALGQEEQALGFLQQALPITQEIGEDNLRAITLADIGAITSHLGRDKDAMDCYQEALSLAVKLDDKPLQGGIWSNIGGVFEDLGEDHRALDSYLKAISMRPAAADKRGAANTLDKIGAIYSKLEQNDVAMGYLQQALDIQRDDDDQLGQASTLEDMGQVDQRLGNTADALEHFHQAFTIQENLGDRAGSASTTANIGGLCFEQNLLPQAFKAFVLAEVGFREVGDRANQASDLSSLGITIQDKSPAASAWLHRESIGVSESLRADSPRLGAGTDRSFSETIADEYCAFAVALGLQNRVPAMQEALALSQSDEVGPNRDKIGATAQELKWTEDLEKCLSVATELWQKEAALLTNPAPPEGASQEIAKLRAARATAEEDCYNYLLQVVSQGERLGPSEDPAETPASVSLASTLGALPEGSSAVYAVGASDGLVLLVVRRDNRTIQVVRDETVNKTVDAFKRVVQDKTRDPRPLGQKLYNLLVKPIESQLSETGTTFWFLTGQLQGVPLGALWDGKEYLFQKYPSSYFNPGELKAMGDVPHHGGAALVFGTTSELTISDPVSEESLVFPKLPGVGAETESVGNVLGVHPALDKEFTLKTLLSGIALNPSTLHLASHFRNIRGDDRRSFLVMGDGTAWTVEDIKALPDTALRGVDLVTLSACATASGERATGGAAESFASWMQRKGAGAVISTLWPIADESTSVFMTDFYNLRKQHPEWTKLQALCKAQLDMVEGKTPLAFSPPPDKPITRSGSATASANADAPPWPSNMPQYSHPYYWAPFILSGNWR